MTKQSSFKKAIRARMKKTGERYAAARLAMLSDGRPTAPPGGPKAMTGYAFRSGAHGDSARLRSALAQAGVVDPATGEAFTEAKLYGLGGGTGFMYFLFEYDGHPPMMTFACGSWTMPGPVLDRALGHAGIASYRSETGSQNQARTALDAALERDRAAHVTVDFASLPWSGVPEVWRGGLPRQVNVAGRDGDAFLIDDGAAFVLSGDELAAARSAPRKQRNRLVTFPTGPAKTDPITAVREAMAFTARNYCEAPVRGYAGNFGLRGLEKLSRIMADPKDRKGWKRVFDTGPLAFLALYRTWECAMIEYTAPAGGRPLYAAFLGEAAELPGLEGLVEARERAVRSSECFEALASEALAVGGDALTRAAELTEDIDDARRSGGADAGERVRALRSERAALGESFELDEAGRAEAYAALATKVEAIVEAEHALVLALNEASQ